VSKASAQLVGQNLALVAWMENKIPSELILDSL